MPKLINLTGMVFGRLTVVERAAPSAAGNIKYLCLCECGNEKIVHASALRSGLT